MISWRLAAAHGFPWDRALYHGVFHSISAFCNAGLALYPDNLVSLRTDRVIVLTMAALIVLGGLGFIVLYNLSNIRFWNRNLLRRGRLNLHSRVVLLVSAGLILTGWLAFYLLEREGTLSLLPEADRITCSLFQSITPRTAGFNVVNMAEVHPATELLTVVLMFIGGSPASTAGGVKTTTLAVLAVTVLAITRSRERPALGHKTVPESIVREAITIFVLGLVVVVAVGFFLAISEKALLAAQPAFTSQDLVFETVSAFGTVGLSTGVTPYLSTAGKLSLSLCMFIGRLGPLTMAMIIGRRAVEPLIRYPEEPVVVG
jgi:trk system potassium uptake protein TrkH